MIHVAQLNLACPRRDILNVNSGNAQKKTSLRILAVSAGLVTECPTVRESVKIS